MHRCGQAASLTVKDEGPGIPESEKHAIFEKFVQSSQTKSGAGGTGLGLSICQEIVEAHKGRIWVENHSDGGAVFQIELPLRKEDELRAKGQDLSPIEAVN